MSQNSTVSVDHAYIEDSTSNPFDVFTHYEHLVQAIPSEEYVDTNRCVVSTISKDNTPNSRIVFIREKHQNKFVFYSHSNSQKGQDMQYCPWINLLFFWSNIGKQITISAKVLATDGTAYFKKRHRLSQIASRISKQSKKVESYATIVDEFEKAKKQWVHENQIPLPTDWTRYEATAYRYEFLTHLPYRLNKRTVFEHNPKNSSLWDTYTLYP